MSSAARKVGRSAYMAASAVLFGFVGQPEAQDFDLSILIKKGDTIAGKTLTDELFDGIRLNDTGDVVFHAEFDNGQCGGGGVTLPGCGAFSIQRNQLLFKSGDVITGKTLQTFGVSGLNNNGVVLSFGLFSPPSFPPGSTGLFTHDGAVTT